MKDLLEDTVLSAVSGSEIFEIDQIQELWSGYGTIKRYGVRDSDIRSVIVKHVSPPTTENHPRGWSGNRSHARKLKSYEVETNWYRYWSDGCSHSCYVPKCYALRSEGEEFLIVLEDLDLVGFSERKNKVSI